MRSVDCNNGFHQVERFQCGIGWVSRLFSSRQDPNYTGDPFRMFKIKGTSRMATKIRAPKKVKDIFLAHATNWLSEFNVVAVIHQNEPPFSYDDVILSAGNRVTSPKIWTSESLLDFVGIESLLAPCFLNRDSNHWRSIENHNRTAERMIGKVNIIISNKHLTDDGLIDNKCRAYILSMEEPDV